MKKDRIIKVLNESQPPYEIIALSCKQGVCRLEIINTKENTTDNLLDDILRYFLDNHIEVIKSEKDIYSMPLNYGQCKAYTLLVINIAC